jgi:hypothetical protein
MLPISLALIALLVAPAATHGQEAVPRETFEQADPGPDPVGQAIPRGSRPQGDNPRIGTAVPRSAPPAAPAPGGDTRGVTRSRTGVVPHRGRTVIVGPRVYNYYSPYRSYYPYGYYYPYRYYYPYGYSSFGLGYLYYDPYRWHPGAYPSYSYGYRRSFSSFDIGELRLDVSPRHTHVYVDGYFAGVVDDYDGAFQAIRLAPGVYRIEIVAPGYETLTFDARITRGQKIRYQGELYRQP